MNRRGFLALLSSAAAGTVLGQYFPEQLLLVPKATGLVALPAFVDRPLFSMQVMVQDILALLHPRVGTVTPTDDDIIGRGFMAHQLGVDFELAPEAFYRPDAWNTRAELVDRFCKPIAQLFAMEIEHRGINTVGELALPSWGFSVQAGIDEAVTFRDAKSGIAMRALRWKEKHDSVHRFRFDVLGGRA